MTVPVPEGRAVRVCVCGVPWRGAPSEEAETGETAALPSGKWLSRFQLQVCPRGSTEPQRAPGGLCSLPLTRATTGHTGGAANCGYQRGQDEWRECGVGGAQCSRGVGPLSHASARGAGRAAGRALPPPAHGARTSWPCLCSCPLWMPLPCPSDAARFPRAPPKPR
jgi:hypothetical protein